MYIDSHVHLRDEEWAYKETIKHGLEVARDSGVDAVFDMPNLPNPVFNRERVLERLELAKDADVPEVFYGTFIGLTADKEQVKQAVSVHKEFFPHVVGFKLFVAHSTGRLGVIRLEDQAMIYETVSNEGYKGILFVHAEKESEMNESIGIKFNLYNSISHCLARPVKAEVESIKDQIFLALKYKFPGKFHIAHISHPDSVDLVLEAKRKGLDISCGVTPHHLFYDWNKMNEEDGLMWKMNPPLREPGVSNKMIEYLRDGKIDFIETDHAPHDLGDKKGKEGKEPASGITSLNDWPIFAEYLRTNNFSDKRIKEVTFDNAAKRFEIDIKCSSRDLLDRSKDYSFRFHQDLAQKVGWK